MSGIDSSIVVHEIKTYPMARPVKQKLRQVYPLKAAAIKAEVEKLLKINLSILYCWRNGYRILFLWTKSRELFESVSISEIWIKLVPKTTFWLHTSIRSSIIVLGVSSSHLWMDFPATIRLGYCLSISIRWNLYARGEPLPTISYLLALITLGPHSSVPCPMRFMTLRILWSLTSMISLQTHNYRKTILGILEIFFWDVTIKRYN